MSQVSEEVAILEDEAILWKSLRMQGTSLVKPDT
jgi:hypothetical protein